MGPHAQKNAAKGGIRPLRVVAIGGGTGLSTLLKGLKQYVLHAPYTGEAKPASSVVVIEELTAVVTVTDDGGSSGRLRREFGMLPPGDIRNCIVALSEDEALMSRLFKYRFPESSKLEGHSFGNLFLCALSEITGDFAEAVRLSSDILATRGHIYPATTANCELEALMDDGSRVRGETKITASKHRIVKLEMIPADVQPMKQTLEAIANADMITVGPGSLFTSLIPNLLVHGIPEAIAESRALKVFVCNLMTQANESLGLTAADHLRAIRTHAGGRIFDAALVNTQPISDELKGKYALEGASQIIVDTDAIKSLGVEPILGNFLLEDRGVARHDTYRVAEQLMMLVTARALTAAS
ncbi:MAG TPA: uridine diphosphate-N-acetylglucosamine-binding protein YvcK [Terriglobales bacterium]|nr:uridine diphosphate-N-acetylglucosamine-binding protein YvcK [Terriglobales bacterium]